MTAQSKSGQQNPNKILKSECFRFLVNLISNYLRICLFKIKKKHIVSPRVIKIKIVYHMRINLK